MSKPATIVSFTLACLAFLVPVQSSAVCTPVPLSQLTLTESDVPEGQYPGMSLARPSVPAAFNDDDSGCVPDTSDHLKCSAAIGKNLGKFVSAVIKCHCKQATAAKKGVATANADEEACEDSGAKSARGKFDAAIAKLAAGSGCTSAQIEAANGERDALLAYLDQTLNGQVYCDGGTPLGDDDAGNIPSDKNKLNCACAVGKNLSKLFAASWSRPFAA